MSIVGEGVGNTAMGVPMTLSPAKRASPHSANGPLVAASIQPSALSATKKARVGKVEVPMPVEASSPALHRFTDPHQMAMRAPSAMSVGSTIASPGMMSPGMMSPGGVMQAGRGFSTKQQQEDDKQRRLYRVGLSYRCGRCGKPKKGHVCDVPEGEEGPGFAQSPFGPDGQSLSPQPAILATTVRKGTPPALLGSPLLGSPQSRGAAEGSPLNDVKISGEASTIFKDMVAALGENTSSISLASPVVASSATSPGAPPQMVTASGISPLAASAIAAGSVSSAAATVAAPVATPAGSGGEPQLSEMDMMLADLAFAARPPPVMTPDEGGLGEQAPPGLGSLSPSNFSPGTMIQQLIATNAMGASPGGTNFMSGVGMDAAMLGVTQARRATVVAQPTA